MVSKILPLIAARNPSDFHCEKMYECGIRSNSGKRKEAPGGIWHHHPVGGTLIERSQEEAEERRRSDTVERVITLLEGICPRIEKQLRPYLMGLTGPFVSAYLPQNWVFETEMGTCRLVVDVEGNAVVLPGCSSERDVTIQWNDQSLTEVLQSGNRGSVCADDYPKVTVHTNKGRTVFDFIRKQLGL